jgi:hypothetical protein
MESIENPGVSDQQAGLYRSGVAARLAGLPVETLRVWERRYGISNTGRSAHGQRLYSDAQVSRLRMLKQLVDQGHPIGALAPLALDQLAVLAVVPPPRASSQPLRVGVVGVALARRLDGGGRELIALDIVAKSHELDGAAAALADAGADLVLMEMSELDDSALPAIVALRQQLGVPVLVLYRFCASATIRKLRAQGCLGARAPTDVAEIVLLCELAATRVKLPAASVKPGAPAARRFDDDALHVLATVNSSVPCECPRHLSDLLLMLNSFERYSEKCASRTVADARLHEQLNHAAGSARVLLEDALERLARADGLPLPAGM